MALLRLDPSISQQHQLLGISQPPGDLEEPCPCSEDRKVWGGEQVLGAQIAVTARLRRIRSPEALG